MTDKHRDSSVHQAPFTDKIESTAMTARFSMRQATESTATAPAPDSAVFLRIGAVTRLTSLGRSTIYRLMAEAKFPAPVRLSNRAVGWRRADLERWSAERPPVSH